MFETLGFETLTAPQVAVFFGLGLGLFFGVLAQVTRFCLRRALVGEDRRAAAGIWLTALAVAVIGTQFAIEQGYIDFANHRFMATDLPVVAIVVGGVLFGAGMVLTRGCVSRLTVLTGSGNLRALSVLLVFAIVAHATLKGILAPVRTMLGAFTISMDQAALPGSPMIWVGALGLAAIAVALNSGNRPKHLLLAAALGALAPLGWVGTGFILYDDFDPIAMESLSFTAPYAEALFYTVASSSISASFGTGLIGGVFAGALISALARKEFHWQSFESPTQTGRYLAGAFLMGVGGVLAGGCTVGAGLSGIPTLSIAAVLALSAISIGALVMARGLGMKASTDGFAVPAE